MYRMKHFYSRVQKRERTAHVLTVEILNSGPWKGLPSKSKNIRNPEKELGIVRISIEYWNKLMMERWKEVKTLRLEELFSRFVWLFVCLLFVWRTVRLVGCLLLIESQTQDTKFDPSRSATFTQKCIKMKKIHYRSSAKRLNSGLILSNSCCRT